MSPQALFISGAPASGKTTLGRALAARLRAALLDLDAVTGELAALLGDPDHPPVRAARYEALLRTALDTLRAGTPAVLVAPFTAERADPAAWREVARRVRAARGSPVLVWADCPPELVLARMRARAAARDAGKLADPGKVLRTASEPPRSRHVRVDATRPIADQLAQLARHGLSGGDPECAQAPSRSTTWPPQPG